MDPEQRTHNPLVLGSNPSGPTTNPLTMQQFGRSVRATAEARTGQLKLFSQLEEREFYWCYASVFDRLLRADLADEFI